MMTKSKVKQSGMTKIIRKQKRIGERIKKKNRKRTKKMSKIWRKEEEEEEIYAEGKGIFQEN